MNKKKVITGCNCVCAGEPDSSTVRLFGDGDVDSDTEGDVEGNTDGDNEGYTVGDTEVDGDTEGLPVILYATNS